VIFKEICTEIKKEREEERERGKRYRKKNGNLLHLLH